MKYKKWTLNQKLEILTRSEEILMTELKKGPDLGKLQMVRDITLGKKPA
ncbi:hypothetical protein [Aureibaculum luteum]|nr:hypothetical protein [Aureibaculum luteum]